MVSAAEWPPCGQCPAHRSSAAVAVVFDAFTARSRRPDNDSDLTCQWMPNTSGLNAAMRGLSYFNGWSKRLRRGAASGTTRTVCKCQQTRSRQPARRAAVSTFLRPTIGIPPLIISEAAGFDSPVGYRWAGRTTSSRFFERCAFGASNTCPAHSLRIAGTLCCAPLTRTDCLIPVLRFDGLTAPPLYHLCHRHCHRRRHSRRLRLRFRRQHHLCHRGRCWRWPTGGPHSFLTLESAVLSTPEVSRCVILDVSNALRLARLGRRVAIDLPLSVRPLSPSSPAHRSQLVWRPHALVARCKRQRSQQAI